MNIHSFCLALSSILLSGVVVRADPLGTAFTYQGRLQDGTNAANGLYDLRFAVYDSAGGSTQLGPTLTNSAVPLSNGLFTVTLDFGANVFTGNARWLETAVRTSGIGDFGLLPPRQPLTPAPYALYSSQAGSAGSVASAAISASSLSTPLVPAAGQVLSFNGGSLAWLDPGAAVPAWLLAGNAGTTPGSQFLGTTDNQPLELKVNGQRALRLEPGVNGLPNLVGGAPVNTVDAGVFGGVIGGGGEPAWPNHISADDGTIAGGKGHQIGPGANDSAIGGGMLNTIEEWAFDSVIAGGHGNIIRSSSAYGFIGGGVNNTNGPSSIGAVVPGGRENFAGGLSTFAAGRRAKAITDGSFVWADYTDADFASTGNNQFLIRAGGGVGINTNNPNGAALNVNGTIVATAFGPTFAVTQNQPLEFTVNGLRVLRLEPTATNANDAGIVNVIGGSAGNSIAPGVIGSVIAGGGAVVYEGLDYSNIVSSDFCFLGGGGFNSIATNCSGSVLVGGVANSIQANAGSSVLGGGFINTCAGAWSTVPGGYMNFAGGFFSFAAGRNARAVYNGDFVWGDSQGTDFTATAQDQFLIRATGGVGINTNNPNGAALNVNGTVVATAFIGGSSGLTLDTTDNQPLELNVNHTRALQIEATPTDASHGGIVNLVGGSPANSVDPGVYGATIAGGGAADWQGQMSSNRVSANFAAVGGGLRNTIDAGADQATIGGGDWNRIQSGSYDATISGGGINQIQTNAQYATVSGGEGNWIWGNSSYSTIAGGMYNHVFTNSNQGAIGGGYHNRIGPYTAVAVIAGGYDSQIDTNSDYSLIGGGYRNYIAPNTQYATLAGGASNLVSGAGAFIGGGGYDGANRLANVASGPGSVIAGGTANVAGGSRSAVLGGHNNSATNWYATVPGGAWNTAGGQGSFAAGQAARALNDGCFVWNCDWLNALSSTAANQFLARASGGFAFYTSTAGGATLAAGSGSWTSMSDRHAKENFAPVDLQSLLDQVAELPLFTWNYKAQDPAIRHLGPMAQDFKAAFGLGETDTGITSVDAEGVALAAIQGLNHKLEAQQEQLRTKDARIQALEKRIERLEARLTKATEH